MKLYIYELNFFTERAITEHCCEAIETPRTFTSPNGKSFPAIYMTRISKASMPRLQDIHNVVSTEPLTEEQVKTLFCANREETIKRCQERISEMNRSIEKIANAEFWKG